MQYQLGRLHKRWVVYWHEQNGKRVRYRLQAQSKSEADAEAARVWAAHQQLNPSAFTFRKAAEAYLKHMEGKAGIPQVKGVLRWMLPKLGDWEAHAIDDDVMAEYIKWRKEDSFRRRGKELAQRTQFIDVNIAQCVLNYAYKKRLMGVKISLTKPQIPPPKDVWLDTDQVRQLLGAMQGVPHLYTATLIMLSTAARVGATLDLTWDRVDFERNTIDLRHDPKRPAKGRAFVPMNSGLREHLLSVRSVSRSDYVVEWRGKQVKSIKKGFKAQCVEVGLNQVTPHVLRHTAAVHLAAADVPMARISQFLGHSSTAVTERIYARFAPGHLRGEAQILDFK